MASDSVAPVPAQKRGRALIVVAALVLAAGVLVALGVYCVSGRMRARRASRPELLTAFEGSGRLQRQDYLSLADYFQNGFDVYRNGAGTRASFPGLHSQHGRRVDSMEAFSRLAPLLAVRLRANPDDPAAWAVDTRAILQRGWTNGAEPASSGYWGPIADNDQRICEAADVALSIWLLRDSLWRQLPESSRQKTVNWLLLVNHRQTPDNNWHLFVTYINVVVASLGYPADMAEAHRHFDRFRSFYAGDGWFSDGPEGRFDYYNAWGIHYQLFWIHAADPSFAPELIPQALDAFAKNLLYLVGSSGVPMMGRSLCYRMAIPAPLILDQALHAQALDHPSVSAGEARRALDVTWRYFIQHGAIAGGTVTQGYCGKDARLIDSYSGPSSCLWSLRSLISALYLNADSPFWTGAASPLPVERGDYTVHFAAPGWTVIGKAGNQITINTTSGADSAKLKEESLWMGWIDRLLGTAHRPENMEAKYGLHAYRSDSPFCGCAAK